MSNMKDAAKSAEVQAGSLLYSVITAQEFDYFSSSRDAEAHADAEGIYREELTSLESGYTRLPRYYSDDLEDRLSTAVELLAGPTPQTFLHSDRYKITLGQTSPKDGQPNVEQLLPQTTAHRSCSLRVLSCNFVQFSLIPRQDGAIERAESGPVDLKLGRNVLLTARWLSDGTTDEEAQAIRDSQRDWESVLVIGDAAIQSYLISSDLSSSSDKLIDSREREFRAAQAAFMYSVLVGGYDKMLAEASSD
ncbi:MAG TPA: hypothetical protein VK712_00265 [Verrucomicrobiae bacterium]|jgi:hypothetical protein|nr:hypothetical protein [Verrucomicrobiae bacterium]